MITIYKMTNIKNGRMLIGCTSKDLKSAKQTWMCNASKTTYQDYELAKDKKKYGNKVFEMEILEQVENRRNPKSEKSTANEKADNYIEQLKTLEPEGYNKSFLGIRKTKPDYYEKKKNGNTPIVSMDSEVSYGTKNILENEMKDLYGIEGVVKPDFRGKNKQFFTKETVDGLRQLADDLEKYGNIDALSIIPKKLSDEVRNNGGALIDLLNSRNIIDKDTEYMIFPSNQIQCIRCGKYFSKDHSFYDHIDKLATADGKIHICMGCLEQYCMQTYEMCQNPLYTIISVCQLANVIVDQEVAEMVCKQWENRKGHPKSIFISYLAELKKVYNIKKDAPTTMLEFRNSHFVGDIFGYEEYHPFTNRVFIRELNEGLVEKKVKAENEVVESLEDKWGRGFKPEEYKSMEEEYHKLEKFLTKKTDLHIEALKKYIIYSLKEKLALAEGKDLKEIKEWSSLADKAADNAQLKVKQLTGDFGDGVDSFAQLAETVEEYYSAIPTLPKCRKMPYDDMDFLIWQNVNYIRRLEGKPEASYEDIYHFYDDELVKKMRDSGMTEDQIAKAKEERNAVFQDLSDTYQEPLWLLPTLGDDEEGDDEEE